MSTVEEIEKAIAALPKDEFWKLTDRLVAQCNDVWDKEMEEDSAAGCLDALWQEAEKEIAAGETVGMDEFLRQQKLPE
jgi:hypothetical protein